MALQIGIDLGTSGCRAVAIDPAGSVVGEARTPLPPSHSPAPGQFEQQPEAWWAATLTVLDRLLSPLCGQPIHSLAVDGTSATLLLCDHQGTPLTPALMYNDRRSTVEAEQISALAAPQSGAQGASCSLAKLLHLYHHHRLNNGARYALHQADWISARLSGMWGWSDSNNCLKMGYDPLRQRWPGWIGKLGIPLELLPRVLPPGTPYGTLEPSLLRRWNLRQSEPVRIAIGTTDSTAAAIAAGLRQPGDALTSLGTTLVLKLLAERPLFAPRHGIYSHRIGDQWLVSGASNAGGGVLLEHFSIEALTALGAAIDPTQPTGLDYYPLSSPGERFPHADPHYPPRLTPRTEDPGRFLQGMLEGLVRIEREGYQRMHQLGAPLPRRILSAGGGTQNRAWMALRSAQLPWPTATAENSEAAYGVARLAQNHHPPTTTQ